MSTRELSLAGCTPEPLMNYLKALGVLRLVSEQKDPSARGCYKNDLFWLQSSVLFDITESEDENCNNLINFFVGEYQPTPLVAPWNAGSGFYLKWQDKKAAFKKREASKALTDIESSSAIRFQPYRDQIAAIKKALRERATCVDPKAQIAELREQGKRDHWSNGRIDSEVKKLLDGQMFFSAANSTFAIKKVDKDQLVCDARSSLLNDPAIRWIDAAYVIRTGESKNRTEAPLLGSGGNIGNSDFSARFMEVLSLCLSLTDNTDDQSAALLRCALFGRPTPGLAPLAVDQFDPGRAGGANMHQGMEAASRLNPWDYILMLEGAVVLQSASSKRLGATASGSAFPFTVESTAAGFASAGSDMTRGEQWLPVWHRPCTALEIETLVAEGRSDVGPRRARTGVDFVRAAASLGVDRGIRQFVRIQYQARFGDNYLANNLGRVDVLARESVNLLQEIDPWLNRYRMACDEKAPPRLATPLRHIEAAIFDFCQYGGPARFARILCGLGEAERHLSTAERWRTEKRVRPLSGLSPKWIAAANDGSVEFELALALSGIHDAESKVNTLRANLEPVSREGGRAYATWAEVGRCVVWNSADLDTNLAAVLERRIIDGERAGCVNLPLAFRQGVSVETVATFLAGTVDEGRIAELLWGLVLVDHGKAYPEIHFAKQLQAFPLPRVYALLKLLFLPRSLVIEATGGSERRIRVASERETGVRIVPEPRVLALLRAGRLDEACRIAAWRLRSSGLAPLPIDWAGLGSADGLRLAAALLIPIRDSSLQALLNLVARSEAIAQDVIV